MRNTLIIFLVSGFWHGANWTFLVWGLLNAVYIMPSIIFKTNRNHLDIVAQGKLFPSVKESIQIFITFSLTTFAWIFFRANDLHHAFSYISGIFSKELLSVPFLVHPELQKSIICIGLIILFVVIEWTGRTNKYAIENMGLKSHKVIRWTFYYAVVFAILLSYGKKHAFIYFQF